MNEIGTKEPATAEWRVTIVPRFTRMNEPSYELVTQQPVIIQQRVGT